MEERLANVLESVKIGQIGSTIRSSIDLEVVVLAIERDQRILKLARRDGRVETMQIARELEISEITARRAINLLSAAGLLTRVHGGATLPGREHVDVDGSITGLVVPTSDYYFARIISGAEKAAKKLGSRLVLGVTHYDTETEQERVERLLSLGARGLIIATSSFAATRKEAGAWLDSVDVPLVLMERSFTYPQTTREYDRVQTDRAYGAALAVRHLEQLRHGSIGLALCEWTPSAPGIRAGYYETIGLLGLDDQAPVQSLPEIAKDPAGSNTALTKFLDACLANGTRAAVVHADAHAARLVELIMERNLRVPEDFSVVAYDDEVAAFAAVPLTAVAPPKEAVGEAAMRLLDARLHSPLSVKELPIQHLSLLPSLIVRESTGVSEDRK